MASKKKTIDDKVFGVLSNVVSDLWERPIDLQFLGKVWTVALNVRIDEEGGLEENQILAYKDYSQQPVAIMKKAENAIFDYYQSICGEYRSRLGIVNSKDAAIPLISSVSALSALVKPEAVLFSYARSKPTCGLLFQCTWETEHGLAVKIEGGKVVEVGFQDIVL